MTVILINVVFALVLLFCFILDEWMYRRALNVKRFYASPSVISLALRLILLELGVFLLLFVPTFLAKTILSTLPFFIALILLGLLVWIFLYRIFRSWAHHLFRIQISDKELCLTSYWFVISGYKALSLHTGYRDYVFYFREIEKWNISDSHGLLHPAILSVTIRGSEYTYKLLGLSQKKVEQLRNTMRTMIP